MPLDGEDDNSSPFNSCVLWLDSRYFTESYWWDISPYRNNGIVNDGVWRGDAFYFGGGGNNYYVEIPYSDSLNIYNSKKVTVALLISMIDDSNDSFITLFQRNYQYKVVWRSSDNTPYFQWKDSSGNTHEFYESGLNLSLKDWHFIAFSMCLNGNGKGIECVDGKIMKEDDIGYNVKNDTSEKVYLAEKSFKGYYAYAMLFNRNLSKEELKILYKLTYRKI